MKPTKAQLKSIEKLNKDLQAFAEQTGEKVATLYEDVWTSYTLSDISLKGSRLIYHYDGAKVTEKVFDWDEVKEWLKFWRQCLNRAKRYWATDPDTLDRMADGEVDDNEDDE